jgi:hypothetical protein
VSPANCEIESLPKVIRRFADLNRSFWRSRSATGPGEGYALVAIDANPVMCLSSASFGAICAEAKGLRTLFVVPRKGEYRVVLESYPHAEIASFRLGFWRPIVACMQALRAFLSLKSPKNLLELRVDGILFGDIIYDVVLSYGFATVARLDHHVFRALFAFYRHRYYARRVLAEYDVQLGVFHQMLGLVHGVLAKYLLDRGVESINRVGSREFCARKYREIEDSGDHPIKPLQEHFDVMSANPAMFLAAAEQYLEHRVHGQVTRIDADLAYKNKKVYEDRTEFCQAYGLAIEKPIVFVMLHAFNDWPHRAGKKMLFQDYYRWFAHTMEVIREVKEVNWVIKEHPAAVQFYRTKDLDVKAHLSSFVGPTIAHLGADADFSTASVLNLAHAIVTGVGTAGLEFASFGIPCVLAAEGAYSGFGIAEQPSTVEEYDRLLQRIRTLDVLSEDRIFAAKLVAYFYFKLMNDEPYYFCPEVEMSRLHSHVVDYELEFWQAAAGMFQDEESRAMLTAQARILGEFVADANQTQYWNTRANR